MALATVPRPGGVLTTASELGRMIAEAVTVAAIVVMVTMMAATVAMATVVVVG